MQSYLIDELSKEEREAIKKEVLQRGIASSIEDMFWLPVPETMLSPLQKEHAETCGPYCMALLLEENALQLEMLVRAQSRLHCPCVGYASDELKFHMITVLFDLVKSASKSI